MELEKLRFIVAETLDIDAGDIQEDTAFVEDLGANSLDLFQIIMQVEEEFDIELEGESIDRISSVGEAVEEIKKAIG